MSAPTLVSFVGGGSGLWRIERMDTLAGDGLTAVERLDVVAGEPGASGLGAWVLSGTTSNVRYTTRREAASLTARQEGLGRPGSTCAALIPIRKSAAWWALAQDERRELFEAQSRHIAIGLDYLPAVARRLHHCRDLGQPFDFLTWFEYRPEEEPSFNELVARLRDTQEWRYVEREVDIRMTRL